MTLKGKILLATSALLILLAGALGYAISPTAMPSLAAVIAGLAMLLPVAIVWPVGGLFGAVFLRHSLDVFSDYKIAIPFTTIDINLAAGLSILVLLACLIYFLNSNLSFKNIPLNKYWLLFIIGISLSLPLAQLPLTALQEWLKVIVSFCLFVVGAFYFGLKEHREWLEKLILCALIIPLIIALYQIVTSSGLIGFGLPSRAFGTYAHPNSLAFNLVLGLALLFYFWRKSLKYKKTIVAILLGGLVMLLFTYSRAGLISLLGLALIVGLLEYRAVTLKIAGTLVIIYLLFFPVNDWLKKSYQIDLQNNQLIARFTKAEEDYNSLDWRTALWHNSLQKISQRPLLGWGYGMFGQTLGPQNNEVDEPESHNDYVRLWVETGSLGLASYILLQLGIMWVLFKKWRSYEKRTYQKLQFAILLGILVAILIQSLSDNILHTTSLQWSWLLLLGASLAEPWAFSMSKK